jgi:uncharacterized protein YbjT (DUF2867 family)
MRLLIAGASGFVGHRLCEALTDAGHEVLAMTRHPDRYRGCGTPVRGDVHDPPSLATALQGADAAYYLVHSLDRADFVDADAAGARAFGEAAAAAGVGRIVYLGGLGDDADALSDHLRSRRQVESLLGEGGVPVTTLRAGIVVGHGGISWEMTRQLVDHLPVMITPAWTKTRTQPIALDDVVRYLVGVLGRAEALGRTFDIGGPDVLRYVDMMQQVAALKGKRIPMVDVPLLTPRLSSAWLALVTDVDLRTARNLVDSMRNEVIVRDRSIENVVPGAALGYVEAARRALGLSHD